ncbi:MAG: hypothetical protein WAX07_05365 [Candidatus Altiarchaeia archaeon]
MEKRDYDLHGILSFRINREKVCGWIDGINLKLHYFETAKEIDPDITLNIAPFTPDLDGTFSVDHKYYAKEDYLYCKDSEGGNKWQFEVSGFESGKIKINYNGKTAGKVNNRINPDFIAQNILLRFVEYALAGKGYLLLHAAGVSKDGKAVIIVGRGGTYKTSICMELLRSGYHFLGDDHVILKGDKAYSFPMGLSVFSYMYHNMADETSWTITKKAKLLRDVNKGRKSEVKIEDESVIGDICFISRTNKTGIRKKQISIPQAAEKMAIDNRLEDYISLGCMNIRSGPLFKFFSAYSYLFPKSEISNEMNVQKDHAKTILKDKIIYELEIPEDYCPGLAKEMIEQINQ